MFSFFSKLYCFNKDEAKAISNQIDKEIILELKNEPGIVCLIIASLKLNYLFLKITISDEIEVLILGPCESGKTTFMSQVIKLIFWDILVKYRDNLYFK